MRLVVQRVSDASVIVNNETIGKIKKGYVVLMGIASGDTENDAVRLCEKLINLRIFSDENDKINLSLKDVNGGLLVISQFTLYADCKKGNRPNFLLAEKPDRANELYEFFVKCCREKIENVETGSFGADMKVTLTNDGPFTVILE